MTQPKARKVGRPVSVTALVAGECAAILERIADLEGVTVEEIVRLVLEEFAYSQPGPGEYAVPDPVDQAAWSQRKTSLEQAQWRERQSSRRGVAGRSREPRSPVADRRGLQRA